MILIGTSGSTKCDWRLLKEGDIHKSFSGKGINPFVHSEADIAQHIREADHFDEYKDFVKVVYLYSAGCPTKPLRLIVKRALANVFPRAHHYVNHDIVAAALATYEGSPALTAILGTGSNSCYFDGDIVKQEVPALDFILGDEGAGTYYGKYILKHYLYKQLPEGLRESFNSRYNLSASDVLEKIYFQPHANVYLASFMTFVENHKDHPFIIKMLEEGMDAFMKWYILCYKAADKLKCHFVGSIASTYEDILRQRAEIHNIQVGKIIKEPVNDLVNFLIKKHY
jgi:glucosamine kinase